MWSGALPIICEGQWAGRGRPSAPPGELHSLAAGRGRSAYFWAPRGILANPCLPSVRPRAVSSNWEGRAGLVYPFEQSLGRNAELIGTACFVPTGIRSVGAGSGKWAPAFMRFRAAATHSSPAGSRIDSRQFCLVPLGGSPLSRRGAPPGPPGWPRRASSGSNHLEGAGPTRGPAPFPATCTSIGSITTFWQRPAATYCGRCLPVFRGSVAPLFFFCRVCAYA